MKKIYFSHYVDEKNIHMNPEVFEERDEQGFLHRFSLTIPFHHKNNDRQAVVIMKNPSNAGILDDEGFKTSDDTLYRILDYLYKQPDCDIGKVTIVNLYTMVNGTASYLKEYIGTPEELEYRKQNDEVISQILADCDSSRDLLLAGWGNYQPLLESAYKRRIRDVLHLIGDKPLYRVGPMVNNQKYPGHGKYWYDYEPLLPYPSTGVR
ncbi:DUF1643 domain-containing protein [Salibacterium lacus]|uniref:DUF1643 domain-containing protein n=1 Tax=Salibacterium lacus TaxID=1898109 RepID=A0ABW5T6F9_9BACI